jgi:DNA-binding CsgD family transcriptional regulator
MLRICEHQPPRLGVVISAGPTAATLDGPENQLNEYVRQAALEARAVRTLDALPALARLPHGSELSARQTEIVARLVAGQRPADIARAMFLSPSTIRNHLATIYRKFGVHSQAELLAALLRAVAHHD